MAEWLENEQGARAFFEQWQKQSGTRIMTDKPQISCIVHSPSAEDVAAYFNTLLSSLDKDCVTRTDVAHNLTVTWLQGQMDAAVELARQNSGPVFKPRSDKPQDHYLP